MKLWKIDVNNWGWNDSKEFYFESKAAAEKALKAFPAGNAKYAGNFTTENALELLSIWDEYDRRNKFEKMLSER